MAISRPNTTTFFSPQVNNVLIAAMILMTGITMSIVLSMGDVGIGGVVAFLPVIFGLIVLIINNPFYGLLFYINYSFFFTGLARYIPGVPLGLSIDGVLFLTTLSMIFSLTKDNIKALNNGEVLFIHIFFYNEVIYIIKSFELADKTTKIFF